jgi:hypothetical protein
MINNNLHTVDAVQDIKITSFAGGLSSIVEPHIYVDATVRPIDIYSDRNVEVNSKDKEVLTYLAENQDEDIPIYNVQKYLNLSKSASSKIRAKLVRNGAVIQYRKAPFCHHMFIKLNPNATAEKYEGVDEV